MVTHHLTDARRACYHLLHVYSLWFDSHGTRTHHLTDARRAWYHLLHVYSLWFDSHGARTHHLTDAHVSQTIDYKRGVNGYMLSSRLLNDVFVSRVSQTRDYKRGVNGIMLSSRLLTGEESMIPFSPHLYSLVWLTRDTNTSFNRREESMLPFTPRL
jgi:hypothetical protein